MARVQYQTLSIHQDYDSVFLMDQLSIMHYRIVELSGIIVQHDNLAPTLQSKIYRAVRNSGRAGRMLLERYPDLSVEEIQFLCAMTS